MYKYSGERDAQARRFHYAQIIFGDFCKYLFFMNVPCFIFFNQYYIFWMNQIDQFKFQLKLCPVLFRMQDKNFSRLDVLARFSIEIVSSCSLFSDLLFLFICFLLPCYQRVLILPWLAVTVLCTPVYVFVSVGFNRKSLLFPPCSLRPTLKVTDVQVVCFTAACEL